MRLHRGGPGDVEDRLRSAVNRIGDRFRLLKVIVPVVLALIVLNLLGHSMVSVGAGERAVIFSKFSGVLPKQLGEGWHVAIPWVWQVQKYDVKRQTWTVSVGEQMQQVGPAPPEPQLVALTKDGQQVVLDISVVYHPDPQYVWRLHQRVGPYYLNKVIRPATHSVCRMVVSQYPVTEVYSGSRELIQQRIEKELGESLKAWDIILDQMLLRNVKFSDDLQQAIEAKQVAQQDSLRMDYVVKKQQEEKKQAIILAGGEAQATELRGHVLASYPELVQWEYVGNLPSDLGGSKPAPTQQPQAPAR